MTWRVQSRFFAPAKSTWPAATAKEAGLFVCGRRGIMSGGFSSFLKYLRFLYVQRVKGFTVPDAPRFDGNAGEEFENLLKSSKNYLEYGAGGSTVLAARHGIPTVSIESDPYFADAVRKKIAGIEGAGAVDVRHIDIGPTKGFGTPLHTDPTPERVALWSRYVRQPLETSPKGFYDLVLVDGRWRVACALACIRAGAQGKHSFDLLVDDYSERADYKIVEEFVPLSKICGRTAFFEVSAETVNKLPDEALIDEYAGRVL